MILQSREEEIKSGWLENEKEFLDVLEVSQDLFEHTQVKPPGVRFIILKSTESYARYGISGIVDLMDPATMMYLEKNSPFMLGFRVLLE